MLSAFGKKAHNFALRFLNNQKTQLIMQDFIKSYFGALSSSLLLMGAVYFVVWYLFAHRLKNRKIQLSKRVGWAQIKDEIINTAISILGNSLLILVIFYLRDQGDIQIYTETGKFGWGYEVVTVLVLVLVSDAWFYWAHRFMHHPSVYKYVHALHHQSLDVNPFTSNSFHLVEAILLTLWIIPLMMLMPISATALGVVQALGAFNNLKSHLGYELYPQLVAVPPFNALVTATNHSLHHTQYNGNYGLFFRFWDIVCGTELKNTPTLFGDIHNRKDIEIIDNSIYRTLQIDRLEKETIDTISVYFKPNDRQFYQYLAGQYLTIRVKIKGKTLTRCFSLSSSPQIDDFLRITVRLKGDVSHYFFNDAKVGDTITALYPVGDFYLKANPDIQSKTYAMIAGGSGITPIYAMIRHLINFEPQSKIILFYANRVADNIIFDKMLVELANSHPQFEYVSLLAGQKRLTADDLRAYSGAEFYLCGSDSLKTSVLVELKKLKIDSQNIHLEHYADGYVPWFGLF